MFENNCEPELFTIKDLHLDYMCKYLERFGSEILPDESACEQFKVVFRRANQSL